MKNNKLPVKISKYVFKIKQKQFFALYHSLTGEIIFGQYLLAAIYKYFSKLNKVDNFLKLRENRLSNNARKYLTELLALLLDKSFLSSNDNFDNKILNQYRMEIKKKQFIKTLYFSLSYKCNFNCRYCISHNSIALDEQGNKSNINMDIPTAKTAVDYFFKHLKPQGDKEIVFYGGEPLINFQVLKYIVKYTRSKEAILRSKCKNYRKLRFILCTNGSLLNKENIEFLKKHEVYPAISLDGDQETHDSTRIYADGRPTYSDVLRGYQLAKKLKLPVGISLALGRHNFVKLPRIIKQFSRLRPATMATNTLIDYKLGGNEYLCQAKELADSLINGFKVARKYGIYLVKYVMDNRVKPFIEQQPRLKGCTGTGSRIMVMPDGSLSACAAFVNWCKVNLKDKPELKDFLPEGIENYSPFLRPNCLNCPAIICCGGGCPKNAYLLHGSIMANDDQYCQQTNKFFKWLVADLFSYVNKKKLLSQGYAVPSIEERRKIYGKIKVSNHPLDFQFSPNSK